MGDVIFDAIPLAVVVFAVSISMAKILAKKHNYEIDANQVLRFIFIKYISLFSKLIKYRAQHHGPVHRRGTCNIRSAHTLLVHVT